MKARIIHTKIWTDPWFKKLSRSSRFVFLYLISNQFIGLTGIYEIDDGQICFDVGVNQTELEEAKKQLEGKVVFYNGWVKIVNCDKYQTFKGPKNDKAKENELNLVPSEIIDTLSIPYRYPIDSTSNQYSVISNKKSVISNKKSVISKEKNGIDSLTNEYCQTLSEHYEIEFSKIIKKRDDLLIYCKSTGKKYKDYKATLQAWVRKDFK